MIFIIINNHLKRLKKKEMKKLLFTLLLGASLSVFAGNPINDLTQAKAIAKKEHKKILLKFSGSDWCVPCIRLQKEVMDSEEFKTFSDKNLVVINADFPRKKQNQLPATDQKKNESLAEKYNKEAEFPKLLLLDENGKVIKQWDGFKNMTTHSLIQEIMTNN